MQLCSVLYRALIRVDFIPFHVVVTSFSTILVMTQQGRRKHQFMQRTPSQTPLLLLTFHLLSLKDCQGDHDLRITHVASPPC